MSDIRFTLVIYDYEADHRADLEDWRYDERWDALLSAADAMFDGDVDFEGTQVRDPKPLKNSPMVSDVPGGRLAGPPRRLRRWLRGLASGTTRRIR